MNFVEDIRPISYVTSHADEIMRQVEEKNNPVVITQNGEAKAVLMDVKQYQTIVDTMHLLKILSIGEQDIKNEKVYTHAELQNKIEKMLE